MTIFNIFAPGFAKFYQHPTFSSADDIVPDLTGKVAIVTGGTGGLGLETALQLAKKGAKVYVCGRSKVKGQVAVEKIRAVTGAGEEKVQFLELDLADIKYAKSAAEKFLATSEPLHILVNNAGFLELKFSLSPRDKVESHIAVEVGHFVFTNTLLPAIRKSGPGARIVNVSSYAHNAVKKSVNFEKLRSSEAETELPSALERYGMAKLVGIQFTQSLQRLLANDSIYVNCCHPGAVVSDFNRDIVTTFGKIASYGLALIAKLWFQPVEVGALTQLYLATSPEVESKGIKGQYLWPVAKIHMDGASSLAKDEAEQKRYWEWSEGVVGAALERVD